MPCPGRSSLAARWCWCCIKGRAGEHHHLTHIHTLRRYLGIGRLPVKADRISVFAGRPDRKLFGLWRYRNGYAHQIVLSVGRFEWRRFSQLGLPDDGGLLQLVDQTPPVRRHFFVHLGPHGATCTLVPKRRFGTWTEATAGRPRDPDDRIGSLVVELAKYILYRMAAWATVRCDEARRRGT